MCSDSVDVRYILVVLNSSVGRVIAKLYVTQLQEKQFRMLAQYLTKFPIVRTANNTLRKIADLVQMLLIDDSEYYECEINKVIYEQYGFDIHEIAYIEGLQFNM